MPIQQQLNLNRLHPTRPDFFPTQNTLWTFCSVKKFTHEELGSSDFKVWDLLIVFLSLCFIGSINDRVTAASPCPFSCVSVCSVRLDLSACDEGESRSHFVLFLPQILRQWSVIPRQTNYFSGHQGKTKRPLHSLDEGRHYVDTAADVIQVPRESLQTEKKN